MLVTLEGIDGSGKSTLYKGLKERFSDLDVVFTREPGSPYLGDAVRRAVTNNTDPLVEAALFVADHAVHLSEVVRPALDAGKLIISDRYTDSRFAYQLVSLKGVHPDPKAWLTAVHSGWSITPDLTLLLLIDPEVALSRVSRREKQEHFEQIDFLAEVQENYLARAKEDPARYIILDATRAQKDILDIAEKSIRAHL